VDINWRSYYKVQTVTNFSVNLTDWSWPRPITLLVDRMGMDMES